MKQSVQDTDHSGQERAILVSLSIKGEQSRIAQNSLEELQRLAETAGVEVLHIVTQQKESVDPRWLIGKGKVAELAESMTELGATMVIFNQELSGAQVRNLEGMLSGKIIDRTQLILDIFAQRAKTREGIIQVELAQLSYLLPRLSGHGVHLSRLGGGIGTRGPGETKLETDRRHIRTRIHELKGQLAEVTRHRELHRQRRRKTGTIQVALVGYTNAGKSTLLQRLTQADVLVEDKLFATLDPTSRGLVLPGGKQIMLTDTVGFIQHLPHELVAAFRATLEEVNEAELIIHVVDSSSDMRAEQMEVVRRVLEELGAAGKEMLTVYNKIDLCPPDERAMLAERADTLAISAFQEDDLARLQQAVANKLIGNIVSYRLPAGRGDLIAQAYRLGDVLHNETDGDEVQMAVRVNKQEYSQLGYLLVDFETAELPQARLE